MAKRASARIKRSGYVSRNANDAGDCTASNGDEGPLRKKVRKDLSVWELKKESECFTRDEDHIYSKDKSEEEVKMSTAFKCDRLPQVYLDKPTTFKSPQSDDPYMVNYDTDEGNTSLVSGKRQRCFSKNALNARLNRERKKQYISSLESIKDKLLKQNCEMTQKVSDQEKVIAALQYEVKYLKSLLANSKEISEILKSLTESTGLPVTSSLQSLTVKGSTQDMSDKIDTLQENGENQLKIHSQVRQPLLRRVTSGANFPILQKDVNLGHCDPHDGDELLSQGCEEMDPCLSPVSDLSWDSILLNEYNLDLNHSMFDHAFDPVFSPEMENNNRKMEPAVNGDFQDIGGNESDVGLCLHVNKKKISVELCSLCNTRAQIK